MRDRFERSLGCNRPRARKNLFSSLAANLFSLSTLQRYEIYLDCANIFQRKARKKTRPPTCISGGVGWQMSDGSFL